MTNHIITPPLTLYLCEKGLNVMNCFKKNLVFSKNTTRLTQL